MKNTPSSSSASSSSFLLLLIRLCLAQSLRRLSHTFPLFFSWGHARWAQARGECELWWTTDQNNWYFFIKTHVHPPTHKVTHACTVTHTHTHTDRGLLYLGIPGERCSCSWIYYSIDCVCWYPALEMDPHRQWNRPCVDAAHELRNSNFLSAAWT